MIRPMGELPLPIETLKRCPNGTYEYPCRMIDQPPSITTVGDETIHTYGAAPTTANTEGTCDSGLNLGGNCISYLWLGAAAVAGWYLLGRKSK